MKSILIALVVAALSIFPFQTIRATATQPTSVQGQEAQKILEASLRVEIFSADGSYYDQGLGTLVNLNGETLIITHNHWTFHNFLEKFQKVRILNANNELLVELSRTAFMNSIRFSDPGTLILKAPDALRSNKGSLVDFQEAKTGELVTIVHWKNSVPGHLELTQAKINEIETFHGCNVYYLVTLDGEKLSPGDSGGGIWLNGRLVANSWGIFDQKGSLFNGATQITIAAQFPESYLQVVNSLP
jgi:hypothetical protein